MKRVLLSLILIVALSPLSALAQSSYSDSDVPLILPRAVWESASSVNGFLDWMPEDKDAQSFQGGNPNSNNAIPDYSPIERIVIHDAGCSLSSNRCNSDTVDPISVIQSIYRNHAKTRGWGDIGYNYIIDRHGMIYEGRYGGNGVRGAHVYDSKNCRNFNVGTVGIVLLGNYTSVQPPEAAQVALAKLVGWLSVTNAFDP
ncbi:MAG: N-acetylmuramoyl-L-alanine amidase, partial [Patescibacteria group bacterium]